MKVTASKYAYTTEGFELFNDPSENLIRGVPLDYTLRFYRILSVSVKQQTKIQINDSIITVIPEHGWHTNPMYHEVITTFKILDSNALVYFAGEW